MKNFPVSKWKNIQKIPYFDNAVEYQSIFSSTIKFVVFQEEGTVGGQASLSFYTIFFTNFNTKVMVVKYIYANFPEHTHI